MSRAFFMFLRLFFFIFKSNTTFISVPFYNLKAIPKRLISLHSHLEWHLKYLYVIILSQAGRSTQEAEGEALLKL